MQIENVKCIYKENLTINLNLKYVFKIYLAHSIGFNDRTNMMDFKYEKMKDTEAPQINTIIIF